MSERHGGPANRDLRGGVVHIWEIASGRLRTTLSDFRLPVSSVQFSSDGNLLATGGAGSLFAGGTNGEVKLWAPASGGEIATLLGPPPATSTLTASWGTSGLPTYHASVQSAPKS